MMAIGQWKPMMGAILKGTTFAPEWMGGFGRFVEPVGILAIFNALGRIFWGKVSDLIDRPRAMIHPADAGARGIVDGDTICGVITESKSGREAILAKRVVDATGDADIAAMVGSM